MAGIWKRLSLLDKIWLGLTAAVLLGLLWVGIPHFRSACLLSRGVRALISEGDAQAAIHDLESAVRVEPGNTQAHRWLAKAYLQTGDLDKALAAADTALSLAPDNPLAELELGDVYDRLGDVERAITSYEAGWVGDRLPQLLVNYLKLADESWLAGDRERARDIWRDKVLGGGYADFYAAWRLFQYYADDEENRDSYRQQLTRFPETSILLSSDSRMASYQGEALAGIIGGDLWNRDTTLNVLAHQAWHSDPPSAGRSLLHHLAELLPEDADIWYYLGESYRRQGEPQLAEEAYLNTVNIVPEYAVAYLRLGTLSEARSANGRDQERLAQAATWYQRYHGTAADDPLGLKKLADVCTLSRCSDNRWLAQLEDYLAHREPQFLVDQEIDDWRLLGYDVDEARLVRGEPTALWLFWQGPTEAMPFAGSGDFYRLGDRWVQVLDEAQNLVVNGGFEAGRGALGWPYDIFSAAPETRAIVTDNRDGIETNAGLLDNTEEFDRTSFASGYFAVEPDGAYLQGGWIRSEGGRAYLGRRWAGDLEGVRMPYSYVVTRAVPQEWTHYAGIVSTHSGATDAQVLLLNFESTGRSFFDNVLFIAVGELNGYARQSNRRPPE